MMGLTDFQSIAAMTAMNRSPAGATVPSVINQSGGQSVRKKRTFDIAFLTGQEDGDERPMNNGGAASGSTKCPSEKRKGDNNNHSSPAMDESTSNSTSSSIDVMTNGSLSESELNLSPCHQQLGPSSTLRGITHCPTEVLITSSLSAAKPRSSSPPASTILRQRTVTTTSSSTGSAGGGGKSRKNNHHREEIRFESKRTIDINQTSDSLKIKENLQFSSTLPTSIPTLAPGGAGGAGADLVSSLPFALLPQIGKFPSIHHLPSRFSGKKSESINIISYPCSGVEEKLRQSHSAFPDPYYLNVHIGSGAYPCSQNLMLPQHLSSRSSPSYPGHHPGGHHHHHHPHHHHPLTSQSQELVHAPTPAQISSAAAAAAAAAAATLLPPSLTALTLPAQNVCAKCNIGFRMTSDLVYHMRSHHKRDSDPLKKKREEKLKCPVCHESFRERHHLTRHMTAHQDRAEEAEDAIKLLEK